MKHNEINNLGKDHNLRLKPTVDRLLKTGYSQDLNLSSNRVLMTTKGTGFFEMERSSIYHLNQECKSGINNNGIKQ